MPLNRNNISAKLQQNCNFSTKQTMDKINLEGIYADMSKKRWITSIGIAVGVHRETVRRLLKGKYQNDYMLSSILVEYNRRKDTIKKIIGE